MIDFPKRLGSLITEKKITKTAFAERLNVSPAFVSQMCSGIKQPSDRTIADICREFGVSETWLRTGEGEMYIQMNEEDELTQICMEIGASDDELAKAAIRIYWRLSDKEKAVIHKMVDDLVAELMKKKNPGE